jgi:carboxyl-terminal processing protease
MADQRGEAISPRMRAYVLGKVFQSIPLYFAHWQDALLCQDDLDPAFAELADAAMACDDRRCFSLLLMAFLARLNNGHTRFRDPALDALPLLGMTFRPVEDRWTVARSSVPDIHAGDVLLQFQDKPVETWYQELSTYTVGSPQSRTVQFSEDHAIFPSLLGLFLPESYVVRVEDRHGGIRALTVDRTVLEQGGMLRATGGCWLDKGVAYIKIPSFLSPEFEEQALVYLKEFHEAASLIVDVRKNGGGSTPRRLMRALMDRPYRWWIESSPMNVGVLAHQAQQDQDSYLFEDSQLLWRAPTRDPEPEAYSGRVVLLVDRATWSAAEDFSMPFKDNGRATMIGEPTGGSTGQPYFHTFDNGMMFAISMKRATMPDGTPFEGVGLAPDLHIVPRREDLYAGRDPVLERAMVQT